MWNLALTLLLALSAVGLGGMMPGGFRDVDVHEEGVQNALNFAVVQHNKKTNDMNVRGVMEVVRARSQVVAGIKYEITVKIGKTPCRKSTAEEQCSVYTDPSKAQAYECTFTVWSRPWLNEIQMLKEKC